MPGSHGRCFTFSHRPLISWGHPQAPDIKLLTSEIKKQAVYPEFLLIFLIHVCFCFFIQQEEGEAGLYFIHH